MQSVVVCKDKKLISTILVPRCNRFRKVIPVTLIRMRMHVSLAPAQFTLRFEGDVLPQCCRQQQTGMENRRNQKSNCGSHGILPRDKAITSTSSPLKSARQSRNVGELMKSFRVKVRSSTLTDESLRSNHMSFISITEYRPHRMWHPREDFAGRYLNLRSRSCPSAERPEPPQLPQGLSTPACSPSGQVPYSS